MKIIKKLIIEIKLLQMIHFKLKIKKENIYYNKLQENNIYTFFI